MRAINNLKDVQIVLNQHDNFINNFGSQSIDRHGLKFTNNGVGKDPLDLATVSQLPVIPAAVNTIAQQYYTIVWTQAGAINTGDIIPAFIAGYERTGIPIAVKAVAISAPSSNCTLNIYVGSDTVSGLNILSTDLVIPAGSKVVASSSNFILTLPYVGTNYIVYPVITSGGGAAVVTIEVILKRTNNAQ